MERIRIEISIKAAKLQDQALIKKEGGQILPKGLNGVLVQTKETDFLKIKIIQDVFNIFRMIFII